MNFEILINYGVLNIFPILQVLAKCDPEEIFLKKILFFKKEIIFKIKYI